jgi:hypothetical protein
MYHLYSNEHLQGAYLVWIERREGIKAILLRQYPHLKEVDVVSIMQGCEFYATCHDELFDQVVANAKQEVPA